MDCQAVVLGTLSIEYAYTAICVEIREDLQPGESVRFSGLQIHVFLSLRQPHGLGFRV